MLATQSFCSWTHASRVCLLAANQQKKKTARQSIVMQKMTLNETFQVGRGKDVGSLQPQAIISRSVLLHIQYRFFFCPYCTCSSICLPPPMGVAEYAHVSVHTRRAVTDHEYVTGFCTVLVRLFLVSMKLSSLRRYVHMHASLEKQHKMQIQEARGHAPCCALCALSMMW